MSKNILITGGTGLVGKTLTQILTQEGYQVRLLSRSKKHPLNHPVFEWNYQKGYLEPGTLEGIDTIIHLAGAGVADKKWTVNRKKEILESRTLTTQLLFNQLQAHTHQVKTLIAASAIGIYGNNTGNALIHESNPPGHDFLAHVTDAWETATKKFEQLGVRVVQLRIGVVLDHQAGALKKLLQPPIAAPLGKGKQYMSWIHITDLCRIFLKVLKDQSLQGAYNTVAPNPVTNKQFTQTVAKIFRKPFSPIHVPSIVLKLMLGEMATIVLGGSKISSQKIEKTGFSFKFPLLEDALKDLKQ